MDPGVSVAAADTLAGSAGLSDQQILSALSAVQSLTGSAMALTETEFAAIRKNLCEAIAPTVRTAIEGIRTTVIAAIEKAAENHDESLRTNITAVSEGIKAATKHSEKIVTTCRRYLISKVDLNFQTRQAVVARFDEIVPKRLEEYVDAKDQHAVQKVANTKAVDAINNRRVDPSDSHGIKLKADDAENMKKTQKIHNEQESYITKDLTVLYSKHPPWHSHTESSKELTFPEDVTKWHGAALATTLSAHMPHKADTYPMIYPWVDRLCYDHANGPEPLWYWKDIREQLTASTLVEFATQDLGFKTHLIAGMSPEQKAKYGNLKETNAGIVYRVNGETRLYRPEKDSGLDLLWGIFLEARSHTDEDARHARTQLRSIASLFKEGRPDWDRIMDILEDAIALGVGTHAVYDEVTDAVMNILIVRFKDEFTALKETWQKPMSDSTTTRAEHMVMMDDQAMAMKSVLPDIRGAFKNAADKILRQAKDAGADPRAMLRSRDHKNVIEQTFAGAATATIPKASALKEERYAINAHRAAAAAETNRLPSMEARIKKAERALSALQKEKSEQGTPWTPAPIVPANKAASQRCWKDTEHTGVCYAKDCDNPRHDGKVRLSEHGKEQNTIFCKTHLKAMMANMADKSETPFLADKNGILRGPSGNFKPPKSKASANFGKGGKGKGKGKGRGKGKGKPHYAPKSKRQRHQHWDGSNRVRFNDTVKAHQTGAYTDNDTYGDEVQGVSALNAGIRPGTPDIQEAAEDEEQLGDDYYGEYDEEEGEVAEFFDFSIPPPSGESSHTLEYMYETEPKVGKATYASFASYLPYHNGTGKETIDFTNSGQAIDLTMSEPDAAPPAGKPALNIENVLDSDGFNWYVHAQ